MAPLSSLHRNPFHSAKFTRLTRLSDESGAFLRPLPDGAQKFFQKDLSILSQTN